MATQSRRFIPRLQALDDRSLPSVSYDLQGTFLFVTGDIGDNTVTINDTGTDIGIEVIGVGELGDVTTFTATTPITHIFVSTLEGDDTVVYNLTQPLSVFRLVDADLARGADSFTANISGTSLATLVNLDISAAGGMGADTMVLNAQNVSTAEQSVLNVNFDGDAGHDSITFDYTAGVELGTVSLTKDQKH
jgi:hypothetical protein